MLVKWEPDLPEILEPLSVSLALSDIGVALRDARRVVCMIGAGVSTSAGIQDFRSSAGMYATGTRRLTPQQSKAMFLASCYSDASSRAAHWQFMASLKADCDRVIASRRVEPVTKLHGFMRLLKDQSGLLRVYSQNIDGFEGVEGLSYVALPGATPNSALPGSSSDVKGKKRAIQRDPDDLDLEGDCVQLHGSVAAVRCSVCPWVGDWLPKHTRVFARGKTLDCPACQATAADRKRQFKRTPALLSYIRPALLLYDEHSAASEAISSIAQRDLDSSPDLLLVCGTSLKIPGFRSLVKQFSAQVRTNGGLAIFFNRDEVGSEWDDVFDYHVLADCESFVSRVLLDWGEPGLVDISREPAQATRVDETPFTRIDTLLSPTKSAYPSHLTTPIRQTSDTSPSSPFSSPASHLFSDAGRHSTPGTSQSPPPLPSPLDKISPASSARSASVSLSPSARVKFLKRKHDHDHERESDWSIEPDCAHRKIEKMKKQVRQYGGRKKKAVLEIERAVEAKKARRQRRKERKLQRREKAEREERRNRRADRV